MYEIEKDDIQKRNMIVYYIRCPACGDTIDDLEQSLTE